jgi:hypothetical protein
LLLLPKFSPSPLFRIAETCAFFFQRASIHLGNHRHPVKVGN